MPRPNPSPRVSWVESGHETKEATASSASLLATSKSIWGYNLVFTMCTYVPFNVHVQRVCNSGRD